MSGTEALDTFEVIANSVRASLASKDHLRECNAEIHALQKRGDLAAAGMARYGPRLQDECSNLHATLERNKEYAVTRKLELLVTRERLLKESREHSERCTSAWSRIGQHAAVYFDRCLAAGFREPWSLPEGACRDLRKLLDLLELNKNAKAQLRSLRYRLITARNAQWRAEREIESVPQVLPDALGQHLDSVRRKNLITEIGNIQAEFDAIETEVADRSEVTEATSREWSLSVLSEFLEAAGRCIFPDKPASEPSRDRSEMSGEAKGIQDSFDEVTNRIPDPLDEEAEQGPDFVDEEEDQAPDFEYGTPDLLQEYIIERDYLEEAQRRAGVYLAREQDEVTRAERIMTFGRSSLAFFAEREDARKKISFDNLQDSEQRLEDARDRLLASGGEIPRTPTPEQKNPLKGGPRSSREPRGSDRGSRVSQYSGKIRKLNRRPLNTWRFRTQGAASISQLSKRSEYKLPSLRGRSLSGSFSITPERADRREEYKAEQERIRAEQKRMRDEQERM
ncbi:unnamed protein product [Zymoseptoria tritici ST99CH_3D1]|uniref:Uncharacterized protein n=1 Tax=Zymoseptoria tritici (strain ST99CH_3D7) TaxID=1276538 RepID=A0A1X7S1W3_ZYMT9|nr:unnamed protein product [Zymoseptoria tritici ST99CH_3D7]SMR60084.1 unnamed protein product [Zymoseptoria tritici ST99CH_3D1]